jgi:hypothetical protein
VTDVGAHLDEKSDGLRAIALLVWCGIFVLAGVAFWLLKCWQLAIPTWTLPTHGGFPTETLFAGLAGALTCGVLWLTGRLAEPLFGSSPEGFSGRQAMRFLLGAVITGVIGGWLGFLHVGPGTLLLPAIIVAVINIVYCCKTNVLPRESLSKGKACDFAPWLLLAVPLLLVTLVTALAPAIQSDGLRYHLTAPHGWLRAGRFVPVEYAAHSNLPAMQGLLAVPWFGFSWGYTVYQVIHWAHMVALAVFAGELARALALSLRRDDARAASLAARGGAVLCLGAPVIGVVGAWPFSDVAAAAYLVAGLWMLARHSEVSYENIAVTSLLLGASCAVKVSMLPLVVLPGLFPLWRALVAGRAGARLPRWVLAALLPGLLVLGPWLVKSTVYHGNPLYPAAYGIFGGPEWSDANEAFYKAKAGGKGRGGDAAALLRSPVEVTYFWADFEAHNPGPVVIAFLCILPVFILAVALRFLRCERRLPFLAICLWLVAAWIAWFLTYRSVRHWRVAARVSRLARVGPCPSWSGLPPVPSRRHRCGVDACLQHRCGPRLGRRDGLRQPGGLHHRARLQRLSLCRVPQRRGQVRRARVLHRRAPGRLCPQLRARAERLVRHAPDPRGNPRHEGQ